MAEAKDIYGAIQTLTPGSRVALYEVNTMNYHGGEIMRFHANRQEESIWWQGNEYKAIPIEITGYDQNGREASAAPTLRIADKDGAVSTLCHLFNDLKRCAITRRVTLVRFLDAVNFPEGNPTANPNEEMLPDVHYIEQKKDELAGVYVEFELRSPLALSSSYIPRRSMISSVCQWASIGGYRGPYCGYTGSKYFDADDNPVGSRDQDSCGYTLKSCNLRNGDDPNGIPFGSFPASSITRIYA